VIFVLMVCTTIQKRRALKRPREWKGTVPVASKDGPKRLPYGACTIPFGMAIKKWQGLDPRRVVGKPLPCGREGGDEKMGRMLARLIRSNSLRLNSELKRIDRFNKPLWEYVPCG